MNLINNVKKTIRHHHMFRRGDRIIAAVSGGPDSVFLLYVLNQLRYELGIHIHVAHLNHLLRKNSYRDQQFVRKLAQKWNLPFTTTSVSITKNKRQSSLEEAAREARLDFLLQTAEKYKLNVIVLGHTKDDLAETVLMRILRGTGLSGLRAILPKREIKGCVFVRPLLDLTKKDIETFLKKSGIRFCTDPSNRKTDFFRNKIRLKLLPLLEREYNKDIKNVLSHLSSTISQDYDYLEKEGRTLLKKLLKTPTNAKDLKMKFAPLKKLHPSMQRILIRLAIEKWKGDTRRITFAHITEIEDLLKDRPEGSIVNLPIEMKVFKKGGDLLFTTRSS